jgi:hypothetical protein
VAVGARLSPEAQVHFAHVDAVDTARVRVVVVPVLTPGVVAMTLGRWVLVRRGHESDVMLLGHELVHVEQWRIHGVAGFLRAYLGDYVRARRAGLGHWAAYRGIGFEAEARRRSGG